jgi:hypothetical protein
MADAVITQLINIPGDRIVTTPEATKTLTAGKLVKAGVGNTLVTTTGGTIGGITTVVDTYQVLTSDETVICNKATNFTVTLPVAVVGQKFDIKNIGVGVVTIDGAGTDVIDGETTQSITQWENLTIQCNAANQWIIL